MQRIQELIQELTPCNAFLTIKEIENKNIKFIENNHDGKFKCQLIKKMHNRNHRNEMKVVSKITYEKWSDSILNKFIFYFNSGPLEWEGQCEEPDN